MSLDLLYSGMMVFIRAGGLLALLPVFSGQSVPVQIRLAIAVLLAFSRARTFRCAAPSRRMRSRSSRWRRASCSSGC